jgi:hypothetical protein
MEAVISKPRAISLPWHFLRILLLRVDELVSGAPARDEQFLEAPRFAVL